MHKKEDGIWREKEEMKRKKEKRRREKEKKERDKLVMKMSLCYVFQINAVFFPVFPPTLVGDRPVIY